MMRKQKRRRRGESDRAMELSEVAEWIDRGLTRKGPGAAAELARILGIGADKVSKMRKGDRKPRANEIHAIEEFLGERAPGRPAADRPERWIALNLPDIRRDTEQVLQQMAHLPFLIFHVSRIGEQLERIAEALEALSEAETAPEPRTRKTRSKD